MLRETFVRRIDLAFALVILYKCWIKTQRQTNKQTKNMAYIKLCLCHVWKWDESVKILSLLKELIRENDLSYVNVPRWFPLEIKLKLLIDWLTYSRCPRLG